MASFNKERPYNELPDLPPSVELQSPKILRAYAEAKAKLAGLNQAVKRLPNIAMTSQVMQLAFSLVS